MKHQAAQKSKLTHSETCLAPERSSREVTSHHSENRQLRLDEIIRALVRSDVQAEVARALASATPRPTHVSVAEYAAARSISVSTVRNAVRQGRLPALRIGTAVRVPVDVEIARPANENTRGSQMPPAMQVDQILAKRAVRDALKSEIKRVA